MDTGPWGWYLPSMGAQELLETLTDDELKKRANECFIQAENTNFYLERQGLLTEAAFYLNALIWRSDARVARRDFWMEVGVMVLIGGEIVLSVVGLRAGYQQGEAENVDEEPHRQLGEGIRHLKVFAPRTRT
jgi:hypothetical protein